MLEWVNRVFPQLSIEGVTMNPFIWIKEGKQWILGVIQRNLGVKTLKIQRNKGVMENPGLRPKVTKIKSHLSLH